MACVKTKLQVNVLGERWIDLLIGDRLAIEVDGALGYHVIRLRYRMVMFDWDATLAMILAVMERGDHLSRPKYMTI